MKLDFSLPDGILLQIDSGNNHGTAYPTGRIQKGLILTYAGQELCEEAVGFGVPVIKRGLQAIFPGSVEITPLDRSGYQGIHARFSMSLEEKIARTGSGTLDNPALYKAKYFLAGLIRRFPLSRGLLTRASNLLRSILSWETTYGPADFSIDITLNYTVDTRDNSLQVSLDKDGFNPSGISEMILMNEQGAHHFDQYQDSDGLSRQGKEIGCWDRVFAEEAWFISSTQKISFSLPQVRGATLYRGRELIGNRLAWSGFGYSFPPSLEQFSYTIRFKRLA